MSILIDTHVHIYPSYDPAAMLAAFRKHTSAAGASCGAMMLAERQGVDFFGKWAQGDGVPDDNEVVPSGEMSFTLRKRGEPDVIVVAGRQIACRERIEVLALATRAEFHDNIPLEQAIGEAIAADAVPVLAWGVGKWLFSRAKIVDAMVRRFSEDQLLLGDSSLRPVFWPEPPAMALARSFGIRTIAGSDPLPPKHDETRAGQYAELAESTSLEFDQPLAPQIAGIIKNATLTRTGRRAGAAEFARRMFLK